MHYGVAPYVLLLIYELILLDIMRVSLLGKRFNMTNQVQEKLIYEGSEYSIPLCLPFPSDDTRIKKFENGEFDDSEGIFTSTMCWRQYIGSWEIKAGRLYLVKLEGKYQLEVEEAIFADWYSGEISLPHGELLDCNVELGFQLKYEQELIIKITDGVVTETKVVDCNW